MLFLQDISIITTAVFYSESIECFPVRASKFFLKFLVTIPVAPIITGIIVHFRFRIHCISIHKLLHFNFFSASFIIIIIIIIILSAVTSQPLWLALPYSAHYLINGTIFVKKKGY